MASTQTDRKPSEEIDQLLQSLWQTQETQELAVDAHADLADQIDAKIAGITARMQYLIETAFNICSTNSRGGETALKKSRSRTSTSAAC